jgi:hypothetical protein
MRLICLLMWDIDGYAVQVAHRDVKMGTVLRTVSFADDAAAFAAYPEVDWMAPDPTDPRPLVAVGYRDGDQVRVEEDAPEPEEGDPRNLWHVKLTATVKARTGEEAVQRVSDVFREREFDEDVIQYLEIDWRNEEAVEGADTATVRCKFRGKDAAGITAPRYQKGWAMSAGTSV